LHVLTYLVEWNKTTRSSAIFVKSTTPFLTTHPSSNMSSSNGRAIVCRDTLANGGWKMEDVSVRKPGEGELLIDMVASVCPRILLFHQQ
jgi:hypothetical protein